MKKVYSMLALLFFYSINSFAQDPCTNITTISCGNNITFSQTGAGDPNYFNGFGGCINSSAQGGKEQIYSFTPATTGTYEFNLTTATGGVVQYLWKEASLTCNPNAWNCIDRTGVTGSVGAVNFVAGTTYYIMLNAEPTSNVTHVFNISCARIVCSNIPTITCGTPTTFTNIGYGDPNYFNGFGGCINSSTQGGKEQIYLVSSSTPYSINVSNASGGVVQYLWKLASLECDNSNWTCLERKSPTELGLVANTNTIPLNVPIYLMLNAESANSTTTNVFNINCTPLGNEDFLNEPVRVYPIPVKTVLNLQFQNEIRIDKVIITDITGKKILEQNTVSTQINVENLAKGIYIIEIYSESKKFKNKFIKE